MARRTRRVRFDDSSSKPVQRKTSVALVPEAAEVTSSGAARKNVAFDFAEEYYHVYQELRTLAVVTVLMFAVMIALAFVI